MHLFKDLVVLQPSLVTEDQIRMRRVLLSASRTTVARALCPPSVITSNGILHLIIPSYILKPLSEYVEHASFFRQSSF